MHRCAELNPVFDRERLTLDMEGVDTTHRWERAGLSNPPQI